MMVLLLSGCFKGDETTIQTLQSTRGSNADNNVPMRWPDSVIGSGLDLKTSQSIENTFVGGDYSVIATVNHSPNDQLMRKWNQAISGRTFFQVPSSITTNKEHASLSSYLDSEFGIYYHASWFSDVSHSALAITQFFGVRRNADTAQEYIELNHADIIFNYFDFQFSTDAADATAYDFHSVLLHELGHFLGMGHASSGPSVMLPYLGIAESNRTLQTKDISTLTYNYTQVGLAGIATAAAIAPSPNEGQRVRGTIELRSNGDCVHTLDGEVNHIHAVSMQPFQAVRP